MGYLDVGVLQTNNIDVGPLQNAPAGAALTLSVNDSLSFTDSLTTLLYPVQLTLSISDTLVFSDAILTLLTPLQLTLSINDTLTFSDSVIESIVNSFGILLTDSLQFFDLLTTYYITELNLVDFNFNFHDLIETDTTTAPMGLGDFFNFSDSIKQTLAGYNPISDELIFSDSIQTVLSGSGTPLTDSLIFSDSIEESLSVELTLVLSDSLDFTDTVNQTPSTSFNSYIRRYLNDVS
jgi:hypothetical protein